MMQIIGFFQMLMLALQISGEQTVSCYKKFTLITIPINRPFCIYIEKLNDQILD